MPHPFPRLIVTAALVAAVLFTRDALAAPPFVAATSSGGALYLLTGIGEVYELRPNAAPRKAFTLTRNGLPVRWPKPPADLTRWRAEWLVVNGTTTLMRFDAAGAHLADVALPVRTSTIRSSGDAVWIVDLLAATFDRQLLRAADAKTFTPPRHGGNGARNDIRVPSPLANLLIVGGGAGELYASNTIGPPLVRRVHPASRARELPVAYSRTKFRATMTSPEDGVEDVTIFSLPVRDIHPLGNGAFVTLRNREDVLSPAGKIEQWLGRRADRYDASGRHLATAVLPRSAHWIAFVTPSSVTAVSRAGDVVTAAWGKPHPGAIVGR